MVIGFNPQFVLPILTRTKIHTVREDIHNRWKPGMKMHMATGVRTKQYSQFFESYCISVQELKIVFNPDYIFNQVFIDGEELEYRQICNLILNDGFIRVVDFYNWFLKKAKLENRTYIYKGKIIHWTDLKY